MAKKTSETQLADQLQRVPLFAHTSAKQRRTLAKLGKQLTWREGSTPITEGTSGAAFFLILEGRVQVVRSGKTVAHLEDGDFVGEIALLKNEPRNATVNAVAETHVFAFGRPALAAALKAEPGMAISLLKAMADRSSVS